MKLLDSLVKTHFYQKKINTGGRGQRIDPTTDWVLSRLVRANLQVFPRVADGNGILCASDSHIDGLDYVGPNWVFIKS